MALFADELTGWGAAAVGGLLVVALGAAAKFIQVLYKSRGGYMTTVSAEESKLRAAERKARREDEEAGHKREGVVVSELKDLVKELRVEKERDRQEVHKYRDEVGQVTNRLNEALILLERCQSDCARRDDRIAALEDALGIPHRAPDEEGSGLHRPLPPPRSGVNRKPQPKPPAEETHGE